MIAMQAWPMGGGGGFFNAPPVPGTPSSDDTATNINLGQISSANPQSKSIIIFNGIKCNFIKTNIQVKTEGTY